MRWSCSRQLQRIHPLEGRTCRKRGEVVDRHARHQHRARLRSQPRAAALRTRPQCHVLLDLLARELRVGLAVAPLEAREDALEPGGVRAAAAEAVAIGQLHAIAVGPVQEEPLLLGGGPAKASRGLRRSARRSPGSAGRSSRTHSPPRARWLPHRSTAPDRAPQALDRSPSGTPIRCTAGTRHAES